MMASAPAPVRDIHIHRRAVRLVFLNLLAACLIATAALTFHLFTEIHRGLTNTPWRDQWSFIGELEALQQQGQALWPTLWAAHWGHRLVLPRLLFLADAKLFALRNSPLILLIFTLQFTQIAILAWTARRLYASHLAFFAATLAAWHLLLSPLQMENFIWGLEIEFGLVYTTALIAFLLLACYAQTHRPILFAAACAAALLSTLSMANGLLAWPCLFAQALYLQLRPRVTTLILTLGTLCTALYLYRYTHPPGGLGITGELRHPIDTLRSIAILLGGPLTFTSPLAAEALGWLGFALLLLLLVLSRTRAPVATVPLALIAFVLLTSASIVAGRVGAAADFYSRAAQGLELLPSRYQILSLLFWASLFLLSLQHKLIRWPAALVVLYLTAGLTQFEFRAATAWADAFRDMDARASSLLLDVDDPPTLSLIWPGDTERTHWSHFLRAQRLSLFTEPRANWPGKPVRYALGTDDTSSLPNCEGAIETRTSVSDNALRLTGWTWNAHSGSVPLDILLTDPQGTIIGLGRAGLLHHDVSGRAAANPKFWRAGWLAYLKTPVPNPRLYGLYPHRQGACQISTAP